MNMVHVCHNVAIFETTCQEQSVYCICSICSVLAYAVSWQVIIRAGMSHDALDLPLLLETWLSLTRCCLDKFLSPLLHY